MVHVNLFIHVFMLPFILVNHLYCGHIQGPYSDAAEHPTNAVYGADPKGFRTRLSRRCQTQMCAEESNWYPDCWQPWCLFHHREHKDTLEYCCERQVEVMGNHRCGCSREEEARFISIPHSSHYTSCKFFTKRNQTTATLTSTQEFRIVSCLHWGMVCCTCGLKTRVWTPASNSSSLVVSY